MLENDKEELLKQPNANIIEQEEVNRTLKEIAKSLKNIPSIGLNYMEYLSAFIYVIYENNRNLTQELETENIKDMIEHTLRKIKEKEKSKKLFSNIIIDRENVESLKGVINELNRLIMRLENLESNSKQKLAQGFEYLIMKAAQNNEIAFENTEFYTPKGLVKTMVKLLNIKPNMALYNPACGTGNFITESAKCADIYVFGEENNISNYNICLTNLWLHDVHNKRIKEQSIEEFPLVDLAIANPPFTSNFDKNMQKNMHYRLWH